MKLRKLAVIVKVIRSYGTVNIPLHRYAMEFQAIIRIATKVCAGMRLILKSCSGYKSDQDSDDFRKYADQCFFL